MNSRPVIGIIMGSDSDYKVMKETAKKHGIKNPIMEIPFEVDF